MTDHPGPMKMNAGWQQTDEIFRLARLMAVTIGPLEADLKFALAQWQNDTRNQFWRRTVIRCLFAVTEALLWNMKHIAPKVAAVSEVQLTPEELEIANEERIVIKNGQSERRPKFLKFRENIRTTFVLFGKVHGAPVVIRDDDGFSALCQTYELRSRLMHPKTPFDPNVADADIDTAQRGVDWLSREYPSQRLRSLKRVLKELRSVHEDYMDGEGGHDCPYWHSERAHISFLAAAVWRQRGTALEEYGTEKPANANATEGDVISGCT